MRVAFVTHYSRLYGANRSLLSLIDGLQQYNVQAFVVAPSEGPLTRELSEREVTFCTIPFKGWMSKIRWKAPARLGVNLAVLPLLAWHVRQWNVDLIHTNSSVIPIGGLLAEVLSLPHTWHVREFGGRDFGLYYDWGERLFRAFMNQAEAIIAVSEAVRQHTCLNTTAPCHVVYNGVISREQLEKLGNEAKEKADDSSSPYTFAIVGQISPAKGQKQALRALHRVKQEGKAVRLLVAGSGASKHVESLRRLCQSLDLDREVEFLGYVPDPFEVYRRANAVLMCSPHEAMGRVTAEAMAALLPVIGFNRDGTAELIDDGYNGLLYDGSTEHLAACMNRFIEEPKWARSLGWNGQRKVRREFTNEAYAQQVHDIMHNVVSTQNEYNEGGRDE